jgi:hypothetical protein
MDCNQSVKERWSRMDREYSWLRAPHTLEPTAPIIPPRQPAQAGSKGIWARIREAWAKLWPKRRTTQTR